MTVRDLIEQLIAYELDTEVLIEDFKADEVKVNGIYGKNGWGKGEVVLSVIRKENPYAK